MRIRDIATAARVELIDPLPQRPSRRYLLQLATTNTQNYYNKISATGRAWAVSEFDLIVSPNVREYVATVSDIGRVLDVTTKDDTNSYHIERPVRFWDLAESRAHWNAPANLPAITFYDSQHTAQRISFFRKNFLDAVYCEVMPIPQFSCVYRVLYANKGVASDMALDDSPILTQHHALIVTKTALDATPGSAWWDSEPENRIRRKELQESFKLRLPPMMDEFNKYVRNQVQPRQTQRLVYSID